MASKNDGDKVLSSLFLDAKARTTLIYTHTHAYTHIPTNADRYKTPATIACYFPSLCPDRSVEWHRLRDKCAELMGRREANIITCYLLTTHRAVSTDLL